MAAFQRGSLVEPSLGGAVRRAYRSRKGIASHDRPRAKLLEIPDTNALLLLLFLFDCGTNLGNEIGAEPRDHCEQSRCDLPCALDGEGVEAEPLAAKAYAAPERRRLLRADHHGRLQTGELGLGQDEVDHERTSIACCG